MRTILFVFLFLFFSSAFMFSQNKKKPEIGAATYYARKFHNRRTASGEIYNREELVCAHKKYPFGTLLRVKNTDNNKEVIVKVIDRGPHIKSRVIDLSFAAASAIDMVRKGVVNVEITEYIKAEPLLKKIESIGVLTLQNLAQLSEIREQLDTELKFNPYHTKSHKYQTLK